MRKSVTGMNVAPAMQVTHFLILRSGPQDRVSKDMRRRCREPGFHG
jgi:hypothetical protein